MPIFDTKGIAAYAENLAYERRRAFSPASSGVAPLQIEIDKNRALSCGRVFQQHRPDADARTLPSGPGDARQEEPFESGATELAHAKTTILFRMAVL